MRAHGVRRGVCAKVRSPRRARRVRVPASRRTSGARGVSVDDDFPRFFGVGIRVSSGGGVGVFGQSVCVQTVMV